MTNFYPADVTLPSDSGSSSYTPTSHMDDEPLWPVRYDTEFVHPGVNETSRCVSFPNRVHQYEKK